MTDRRTPQQHQDALPDLLASSAYERHVRGIRRRNVDGRAVLLQDLAEELGPAVMVEGAGAGLHVVAWFPDILAGRERALIEAGLAAGIGLYSVSPLYDPGAAGQASAGFVLGYAGLDDDALRCGVAVLARVFAEHR